MVPFQVCHIDHLVLRVQDMVRAERFYVEVLGCELARRRDELGLVHLRAGTSLIDLVAVDGPLGRPGGAAAAAQARNLDHLCLRIEPFDEAALTAHLARYGLAADGSAQPRFGADGVGPSIYLRDPDGNRVELKGAPTPGG